MIFFFFFFDKFFLDDFFFLFVFFFMIFFLKKINFFNVWLNSAKDTKLPTYPREGSSHYVVQKIFFFFNFFSYNFFFSFSYVFLQKGGLSV